MLVPDFVGLLMFAMRIQWSKQKRTDMNYEIKKSVHNSAIFAAKFVQ